MNIDKLFTRTRNLPVIGIPMVGILTAFLVLYWAIFSDPETIAQQKAIEELKKQGLMR